MKKLFEPFFGKASSAGIQFGSLDGLRGIAILLVILSHLNLNQLYLSPSLQVPEVGKFGVYIFFSMSSFLLTYLFLRKSDAELRQKKTYVSYFRRRLFRIYPLFLVMLAANFLLAKTAAAKCVLPLHLSDLAKNLLLLKGSGIFWTIIVEFRYYFLLPVLILAIVFFGKRSPVRSAWIALFGIAAASVLWKAGLRGLTSLTQYFPIFMFGTYGAVVHHSLNQKAGRTKALAVFFEILSVLLFAYGFFIMPSVRNALTGSHLSTTENVYNYKLYGLIWSAFIVCHLNGTGLVRSVLSFAPLRFLGIISYSLYLGHLPVMHAVAEYTPFDIVTKSWIIVFAAVFLSALSYLYIERPFLQGGPARRPRPTELPPVLETSGQVQTRRL